MEAVRAMPSLADVVFTEPSSAISDQTIDQSIVPKMSLCKAVAFAAGLGLAMLSHPVHAAPASSGDTVQSLYDVLLSTMKDGRILGQSGRFMHLDPVIRRSFDIASMARLSVGPSWAGLTEAQRQEVTESFGRYTSALYAERFDSYAGEQLKVTGEEASPAGTVILSQIVKSDGEPVNINYLMRQNGAGWQIADVYLNGTISELATRRSEFGSILRTQGINGLIQALNSKAAALAS